MWRPAGDNGYWGDSRVEADEGIKTRWLHEMRGPRWLHGSVDIGARLGFGD
jgi:hypothetical protein